MRSLKRKRDWLHSLIATKYRNIIFSEFLPIQPISLKATSGKEIIKEDRKVFPRGVSSCFAQYHCNVPGPPAQAVQVVLCRPINPSIIWALGEFDRSYNKLCLSQGQIIEFAKKHHHLINCNYGTLTLFKVRSEIFIVSLQRYLGNDPYPDVKTLYEFEKANFGQDGRTFTFIVPII